jgi:hypothetical protein
LHQALGIGDREWLSEQEALSQRAAEFAKCVELRLAFDSLSDYDYAERLAELDGGAYDCYAAAVGERVD